MDEQLVSDLFENIQDAADTQKELFFQGVNKDQIQEAREILDTMEYWIEEIRQQLGDEDEDENEGSTSHNVEVN